MANEKFKVKFGLAVGDTAATIDGTTGNIVTSGSVSGSESTLGNITVGVATDNTISTTTGNLAVTATGSNGVTIDSGTTAPTTITRNSNSTTGNVRSLALGVQSSGTPTTGFGNNLEFQIETAPGNTESAGYISVTSTDLTATDETFKMSFGLMHLGDEYTEVAKLSSTGDLQLDGNLDAQGGTITDSTGALTISTGASNGAITLDPNGTGNVVCTFADGGNLTNDRNYIFGSNRNGTFAAAGDIGFGSLRGISLDNSIATTKRAGIMIRSYGSGLTSGSPRSVIATEGTRGTFAVPINLNSGENIGEWIANGYTSTGWSNEIVASSPAIARFTTAEAWDSGTAKVGTRFQVILMPASTTYSSANLRQVLDLSPDTFNTISDLYTFKNKANTTNLTLSSTGDLTVTGDVRINGNNIQNSAGLASIDLTSGNTLTTVRANTTLFQTAADVEYASINATGSTFVCTGITNFVRSGTVNGIQPPFKAQYKNTTNTDSTNGDGTQILLSTAGSVTQNNIARFDATYITGGNHQFGIAVSSDNFSAVTNSTYRATREKTEILATPTGGGTSSVIMEVSDAKILNNRAHRNAITTGTVARGGEYTVPATANGSIELTITSGSGTTHIDVDAVASDAATGGMYSILIYNNSGSNNIDVQVRNNNVNIGLASNMDIGDRAMASVYVVGGYAACEIMDAA